MKIFCTYSLQYKIFLVVLLASSSCHIYLFCLRSVHVVLNCTVSYFIREDLIKSLLQTLQNTRRSFGNRSCLAKHLTSCIVLFKLPKDQKIKDSRMVSHSLLFLFLFSIVVTASVASEQGLVERPTSNLRHDASTILDVKGKQFLRAMAACFSPNCVVEGCTENCQCYGAGCTLQDCKVRSILMFY